MTKILEVGVRHRQVKRWTVPQPKCSSNDLSASSLDIYEFAPHLLLLIFGMMIAVLVYLFEEVQWKISKSNLLLNLPDYEGI